MASFSYQSSPFGKEGGSSGDSITVKFFVDDTTDHDAAYSEASAALPTQLGGLELTRLQVEGTDLETHWEGQATYGSNRNDDQQDTNESTFSFEVGTTTAHITQSLSTVGAWSTTGTATDTKGAIGVQLDNSVAGFDKLIPQASWTEKHFFPLRMMTRTYFDTLSNIAATMNAATFRTFERGEVMLINATCEYRRKKQDFECQFKFLPLPNVTGITIGSLSGISKLGHDYLWTRYLEELDSTAKNVRPIPHEVFVERVYTFSDYEALRLPDPFA